MELTDKAAELNVISGLMKNPFFFAEIDKYHFDVRDFSERFTRIIFSTINNLYVEGAKAITIIEISHYIDRFPDLKVIFEQGNGIVYLQDCEELSDLDNFDYHYCRLKKFSCLRNLQEDGFDISKFYPSSVLDKDYAKKLEDFERLTIEEIFSDIKKNLFSLEERYEAGGGKQDGYIADGLRQLRESLKVAPEIGFPLQGELFNTVVRGARKGKYYIRSSSSGVGKTRMSVGNACNLAFPTHYDWSLKSWIGRAYSEKVLFITTELDKEEVQTLVLAWVSGINEEVIINGSYTFEQEAIAEEAIKVIEEFTDNFSICHIPDPSIGQIESTIRKQVLVNGVQNVFYDYIFTSPSLLNEFAESKIREDICLMMLSTGLKDLAVELKVYMESSTQITGTPTDTKGIRDQRFIRGAKSIADKCDAGYITVPVSGEEEKIIEPLINKLGLKMPNIVTDVYKVRRSRYKNVKIWSYSDLGTCRVEDILITDGYYNPITDFVILKYEEYVPPEVQEQLIETQEQKKQKLRDLF